MEIKENRVPLNNNTVNKCICSMCSVQTGSACSTAKIKKLKESIKMSPPSTSIGIGTMGSMFIQEDINMQEAKLPEPREIPAVYCSIDKAACSDLNINKDASAQTAKTTGTTASQLAGEWSTTASTDGPSEKNQPILYGLLNQQRVFAATRICPQTSP